MSYSVGEFDQKGTADVVTQIIDDIDVLTTIISALKQLEPDERTRILQTVETFFGRTVGNSATHPDSYLLPITEQRAFSEDRSMSPKNFIGQKQPRTDVERIACLAYYLTHYRDTPHFKTIDLSKLNTEAAQPKFSNAAIAVDNAAKNGYLVPATAGSKQLSGAGEHFVEALPDREAAKAVMAAARPRRKTRKAPRKTNES